MVVIIWFFHVRKVHETFGYAQWHSIFAVFWRYQVLQLMYIIKDNEKNILPCMMNLLKIHSETRECYLLEGISSYRRATPGEYKYSSVRILAHWTFQKDQELLYVWMFQKIADSFVCVEVTRNIHTCWILEITDNTENLITNYISLKMCW